MKQLPIGNTLEYFGLSDIGSSRNTNEDVWTGIPEIGFFALADGMGGRKAGEVAAQKTIEELSKLIFSLTQTDIMELIIELRYAIEKVNSSIFQLSSSKKEYQGMGTTLACMLWAEDAIVYAHVGDSRIYRFRSGSLTLLTQDHSLLSKWLASGKRTQEASQKFPYKHVITRAIGSSTKAHPEMAVALFEQGDIFFICSDGLSDVLSISDMEKILSSEKDLETCVKKLIEEAKIKGSSDNMTLVMVKER